ncbi:uncharacterized protein LOC107483118 isoform X1 [Arachis duranensis]|uniref:Uncharacterized protein LOC107483118 isoform X1 n=1 Tax=Arachis duranensis TaxID=130453 RepID=A0A9C6WT55_ARADU|nr:uncharacterized protein LOC107483118 isoform X1 [Arachis duranensis]
MSWGSIPWWQLLRGSIERSSANGSLLYLPLFLPVKVSKESSYSSDDSDEEEEKPSKTPQKSAKDVEMVDADSAKKVVCYWSHFFILFKCSNIFDGNISLLCSLKPLLHLVLQQVDQRHYLLETCHLVCNDLTLRSFSKIVEK